MYMATRVIYYVAHGYSNHLRTIVHREKNDEGNL